ncbi:MAG TPA: hypothetical protein DD723_08285 [Candidatus Omnitrophica bacterium]|nr:hypothetical protein [Candidatus Omnitrophota bacterium]
MRKVLCASKSGFTLFEVLISVVIVGVIASLPSLDLTPQWSAPGRQKGIKCSGFCYSSRSNTG